MKDLKTYINESFRLGKNKIDREDDDFVDLGLPSDTLWCKYNIGATCESDSKSWYGDYFMWGDIEPIKNKVCDWYSYKYSNGTKYKITKYCQSDSKFWAGNGKPDNKLTLDMEDDAAYNIDKDWCTPTKEQYEELFNNSDAEFVNDYKGISKLNGMLFTSKINDNELFFPAAGVHVRTTAFNKTTLCQYWSSTLDKTPTWAVCFKVWNTKNISDSFFDTDFRPVACSVRAVKR